jgi:hypothetical protein
MQEHIPEEVRGLVGGVQQSLNAFFGLLSFALGIILPDPKDFHIYVSVGYAGVGLSLLCFSLGVFTQRKQFQIRNEETCVSTIPVPYSRGEGYDDDLYKAKRVNLTVMTEDWWIPAPQAMQAAERSATIQ